MEKGSLYFKQDIGLSTRRVTIHEPLNAFIHLLPECDGGYLMEDVTPFT